MSTGIIATQSTDMQKIFCSRIPVIERSNDPLDQLMRSLISSHVVNVRQASGRGDDDDSLETKQLSSITHPFVSGWGRFRHCTLTCHQTGISLWERPLWKKSTSGIWKFFYWHVLYKHGWLQFFDAASRCWTIYLAENDSAPWMAW